MNILIIIFYRTRYMMFIKYAAFHLQHLNLWKNQKNVDSITDNNVPVCWICPLIDLNYVICIT